MKKKGDVLDVLTTLLIVLGILVILVIAIFLLSGQGAVLINKFKEVLFGK